MNLKFLLALFFGEDFFGEVGSYAPASVKRCKTSKYFLKFSLNLQ